MDPNSDVPVTRAKAFGSSITVLTQFMPPAPVPIAGQSMEGLMPTLTLLSDSERGYLAAAATCIQPKAPADGEAAEEDASELGSSAALPPETTANTDTSPPVFACNNSPAIANRCCEPVPCRRLWRRQSAACGDCKDQGASPQARACPRRTVSTTVRMNPTHIIINVYLTVV